ncbi:MAG: hypothetical protein ACRYF9_00785 [Janthinobacterium lividum]
MSIASLKSQWIKAPNANVALVLIESNRMPQALALALHDAITDWEQVAYLHISDAMGLQREWLNAENQRTAFSSTSEIGSVLKALPHNCVLLDLEHDSGGQLVWLGSVCGHSLRFIDLQSGESDMDAQLRRILDTAQELVKHQLQDHFSMC